MHYVRLTPGRRARVGGLAGLGGEKETPAISAPASKTEESCAGVVTALQPFKWAKSADASYLPCGNGFVCCVPPPPPLPLCPPSPRNIGGCAPFTFLLPWPFILIRE